MPRLTHLGIVAARTPDMIWTRVPHEDDWSDFKAGLTRLDAVVTDNHIDGSDPVLHVRSADGRNWTIELSSRARNTAVGLTASAAMPDDEIRIIGRRTRRFGEQRIKALHLTIEGRGFDLFPDSRM